MSQVIDTVQDVRQILEEIDGLGTMFGFSEQISGELHDKVDSLTRCLAQEHGTHPEFQDSPNEQLKQRTAMKFAELKKWLKSKDSAL